ncbi:hypothetical protein F4556_007594 [Kitasatospora gansuensis]|uniref:Uncharacterized protein n=1 Tax=Kitasatospora gansuensis TaxID=258050 RepID=A0A7W7SK42_9ACTN|nr:hypothetical protein [Kitasatospora gansuensis]
MILVSGRGWVVRAVTRVVPSADDSEPCHPRPPPPGQARRRLSPAPLRSTAETPRRVARPGADEPGGGGRARTPPRAAHRGDHPRARPLGQGRWPAAARAASTAPVPKRNDGGVRSGTARRFRNGTAHTRRAPPQRQPPHLPEPQQHPAVPTPASTTPTRSTRTTAQRSSRSSAGWLSPCADLRRSCCPGAVPRQPQEQPQGQLQGQPQEQRQGQPQGQPPAGPGRGLDGDVLVLVALVDVAERQSEGRGAPGVTATAPPRPRSRGGQPTAAGTGGGSSPRPPGRLLRRLLRELPTGLPRRLRTGLLRRLLRDSPGATQSPQVRAGATWPVERRLLLCGALPRRAVHLGCPVRPGGDQRAGGRGPPAGRRRQPTGRCTPPAAGVRTRGVRGAHPRVSWRDTPRTRDTCDG